MRWFVAALVVVLSAWGWFLASPYVAVMDIGRAVEARDDARLLGRLNLQALRNSFARQVAAESALPSSQAIGPSDRQLAAAALSAAASPLLEPFLTPAGIAALLRAPLFDRPDVAPGEGLSKPVSGLTPAGLSTALVLFKASRWRGFRNVYFGLPLGRPPGEQARLQLRLSRFKWRLVSLDLPPGERDRLADAVLQR